MRAGVPKSAESVDVFLIEQGAVRRVLFLLSQIHTGRPENYFTHRPVEYVSMRKLAFTRLHGYIEVAICGLGTVKNLLAHVAKYAQTTAIKPTVKFHNKAHSSAV